MENLRNRYIYFLQVLHNAFGCYIIVRYCTDFFVYFTLQEQEYVRNENTCSKIEKGLSVKEVQNRCLSLQIVKFRLHCFCPILRVCQVKCRYFLFACVNSHFVRATYFYLAVSQHRRKKKETCVTMHQIIIDSFQIFKRTDERRKNNIILQYNIIINQREKKTNGSDPKLI